MNTTYQINREREQYEALATALGHIVLKLFTLQVNTMLAAFALVSLLYWLATELHATVAIFATCFWVLHLAIMLTISIAKGGDQL